MAKKTLAIIRRPAHLLVASIENRIYLVRGQKVMLDADLAELYHVPTSRLNEQVKRNRKRFPSDFMFELKLDEANSLISQNAISNAGRGGRRKPTYAFTEQGVAMLSSVLKSDRAVHVNIAIMRAFIKLREIFATHRELAQKIEELERHYQKHDAQIQAVFDAIRRLLEPPAPSTKRRIGFTA
jgi:DNA-binding PadR family transcriptional regulator